MFRILLSQRLSPKEKSTRPFEFALVRILGNDLVPRHSSSQTLNNLIFVLENEPEFPSCKKFYVVNRIFDKENEAEIIRQLESRGIDYIHIPFEPEEYKTKDWDTAPFGGNTYFSKSEFRSKSRDQLERIMSFVAEPKIRYAMNVNGARNAALEKGAAIAEWVLALDGNCILTKEAFDTLRKSAFGYPFVPYLILPMKRLVDNNDYFTSGETEYNTDEPQIALHRSAREKFDERFPYGFRDKAELFLRLKVPGAWTRWVNPFWLPRIKSSVPERYLYKFSKTLILRLSSGNALLDPTSANILRNRTRFTSILYTLQYLDKKYDCRNRELEHLIFEKQVEGS